MTTTISEASTSKYAHGRRREDPLQRDRHRPGDRLPQRRRSRRQQLEQLPHNVEAFAREHRVLLVDMPQYGKSAKIPIAYPKLTNLARIMRDFMDAIGIERAHFVGNSFGGQMALKTAIDYPDRVGHFVMIGSAPVSYSLFSPQPVEGVKLIGGYYKDGGPSLEKMRKVLTTLVFDASRITDEVVKERYEASIDPETVAVHSLPAPKKQDLTAELPSVQIADARRVGHGRPGRRARRRPGHDAPDPERADAHLQQLRPLGASRARGRVQRARALVL